MTAVLILVHTSAGLFVNPGRVWFQVTVSVVPTGREERSHEPSPHHTKQKQQDPNTPYDAEPHIKPIARTDTK